MMVFVLAAALLSGNTQAGHLLFDVHCSSCHGLQLQGSAQGPPLLDASAARVDFMLRTGRMPALVPWEEEFHKSRPFSHAQIALLVKYVMSRSHGNPQLPSLRLPGNLERGREIYAENCEQCHAATGRGDSVGYAEAAPSLMQASPIVIAEAMRTGPSVMPRFGKHVIDRRGVDDVITYIGWLKRSRYNAGGLGLGNWGPASEGFIVWFAGIGLLLLLVRRIGTTD